MATGKDMKAAEQTYAGFTGIVKWGTILSAVVVAIVVILIA